MVQLRVRSFGGDRSGHDQSCVVLVLVRAIRTEQLMEMFRSKSFTYVVWIVK